MSIPTWGQPVCTDVRLRHGCLCGPGHGASEAGMHVCGHVVCARSPGHTRLLLAGSCSCSLFCRTPEPPQGSASRVSHTPTCPRPASGHPRRPLQVRQGRRCSGLGCPPCLYDPEALLPPEKQADCSLGVQAFGNLNIINFPFS